MDDNSSATATRRFRWTEAALVLLVVLALASLRLVVLPVRPVPAATLVSPSQPTIQGKHERVAEVISSRTIHDFRVTARFIPCDEIRPNGERNDQVCVYVELAPLAPAADRNDSITAYSYATTLQELCEAAVSGRIEFDAIPFCVAYGYISLDGMDGQRPDLLEKVRQAK